MACARGHPTTTEEITMGLLPQWREVVAAPGVVVAPRRATALAADGRAGRAARDRHVRRHRAGADPDGLRPQHRHPDERHRHADLLRRHRRQGAELPGLELRLHRRGDRRHGVCRQGGQRQHRRRAGRHHRLRRGLCADRPGRAWPSARAGSSAHAAGGHRRGGGGDRPEPGRHPDQEHGGQRLRRLDAGRDLRQRRRWWRCSRAA